MSWFFIKPIAKTVETAPHLSPLEQYEQSCNELSAIGSEMRAADQELIRLFAVKKDPRVRFFNGKMYAAVNAMQMASPELRAAERHWSAVFQKFQEKLTESAQLKKAAGLIR